MIVRGRSVDLVKLFLNVKKKGGYKRVTENGLWDLVAKECGFFDISDGLALKIVYAENLEGFLESLKRVSEEKNLKSVVKAEKSISDNCSGCSMDFSSNSEPFLSEVCEIKMKKDATYVKVNWDNCDSDDVCVRKFPEMVYCHDPVKSKEDVENYHTKCIYNNDILDWGGIPNANEVCHASSGGCSMDSGLNLEPILSEVSEIKMKDKDECDSDDACIGKLPEMGYCHDPVKLNEDIEKHLTKCVTNYVKEECLASVEFKHIKTSAFRKESVSVIGKGSDSTVVKEDVCCLKRKTESAIGILDWIHRVARDPCDPAIGTLPESSEWKNYATDIMWKQVLLIHDAMLLKRNDSSNDQQFTIQKRQIFLQKRQRMHPTMYDEPENFRHSPRILSAKKPLKKSCSRTVSKSSSAKGDEKPKSTIEFPDYLSSKHHQIRVNVGQKYQADVNEWTGKKSPYEVEDSKWSGTPIWPLQRPQQHNKNLIEHEPLIGKGRSYSCGCQFPGSMECVRFHVSEKSKRLKLELGIVFYLWRFNRMGEATSVTWTKDDENKFGNTWKLNPVLSLGGFLDQSIKALPNKSRASLVNYYFNVFLLRRRAEQNRTTPNNITSDDDIDDEEEEEDEDTESQHVKAATLDSVKKTHLKKSR